MKTCLLRLSAILVAVILLLPSASKASTKTTLLSQDFSSGTFPPTGWTVNTTDPNYWDSWPYHGYWYRSSAGNGGYNGSAVLWSMYAYTYGNNPTTNWMQTPSVDASSFATASDSTFVDFDFYGAYNYYQDFYRIQSWTLTVMAGSTKLTSFGNSNNDLSNYTRFDYTYGYNDPGTYSGYWRHYHVPIPVSARTNAMSIEFSMSEYGSWGYVYADNFAFDNVVISDTRYDVLTLLGPNSLDFGAVPYLTTSNPMYTKFTNHSSRTITFSNFAVTGTNPNDFTIIYSPSSIPVGATDSVGVTYTPQASGTRAANLTFNTDADVPTSVNVPLSGYGLRPFIALPQFLYSMFDHSHVRFADTAWATLMVTNTGQVPLHISPSTNITGDYPQMYTIQRLPPAIGPDQTDSIVISFEPTIEGLMDAQINIVSDADNGTQVMPLKGIGILARLVVNNAYMNNVAMGFDSVAVGTDSCFQVTLFNPGSDTVAIEKNFFSSADYDFHLTPIVGSDSLIAPNASQTIGVCFQPLKRGYRTAELRIVTNIPLTYADPRQDTSQFTVLFTGTGVPNGNFSITGPSMVDTVAVGKSACQMDTLWNTGQASLTVTSLSVSDSSEFMLTPPTLPLVLAPGTFQTVQVCADPNGMNDRMANLSGMAMSGEKLDSASLPLDVYGTSVCTSDTITSPFATSVCVGDTSMQMIQVTNCGNVATAYKATLSGANASDFSIVGSPTSSSESAGGTATFTVAFAPTTNTPETATLNIAGGAGTSIPLTVNGSAAIIAGSATAPTTAVNATSNFSVTVNNTGTCDWTPGTPTVTAPFTYVSGGTTAIAAGGSGKLNFTFAPTASGTYTQTVNFPNSTGTSIPAANVIISGSTESAGVSEVSEAQGYSLEQNYPNPASGKSQVGITLPVSSVVHFVVVDVKGEVVETLLDQRMNAGTYAITIDASQLASGTYYYQMTAGNVTLSRQMEVER